jgi:transposase
VPVDVDASVSATPAGSSKMLTEAMTVWALLELYKSGEAAWQQDENFGPITVTARAGGISDLQKALADPYDAIVLDLLLPEPGAFYIMDRGYIDFDRLYQLHEAKCFFVIRAKSNLKAQRRYSHTIDRSTGLICDQTVVLTGFYSKQDFDTPLRRVRFKDPMTGKGLVFLTNNFTLPALTITELYRCRWQVELFFKWIKQHLRLKVFYGTTENAVKTQIWIAVSVYVLVAIIRNPIALASPRGCSV